LIKADMPPSTTSDLCWKSATELGELVRSRKIRSRDLLEHFLSRAEELNPAINAIVVWRLEAARRAADVADEMVATGAPLAHCMASR
jgi:amidase